MKMLKTFLLFGLPILLVCVSTFYYTYYKTTHIGGEIGVNPAWYSKNMFFAYISRTKSSGGFLAMDYTETSRIEGVDLETFEYISDGFAKDKNYFYYPIEVLVRRPDKIDYVYLKAEQINLNPANPIRTVSVELIDDPSRYSKYYIFSDAVFYVLKSYSSRSGQSTWGRLGQISSDSNTLVWHKFDYETFKPFSCGYVKDKNGVYPKLLKSFNTIEDVDIESFTAKSVPYSETNNEACYATDKNYQYYYFRDKDNNLEIQRKPLVETK
jgi:DKNYY family